MKSIEEREVEKRIVIDAVTTSSENSMPRHFAVKKMAMPRMKIAKMAAPIMEKKSHAPMAPIMMNLFAKPETALFSVDQSTADRINAKAQLFKEEGKSKEFCETHYYNKVYKNTDSKSFIRPNHFFADLAQYWSESDTYWIQI